MKKSFFIVGLLFAASTARATNWYNTSWPYRTRITFSHTLVSTGTASLANFPVLFSATDANLKNVANGGHVATSTGTDIIFTASDGVTQYSNEVESYTATTGQLLTWVQVPTLSSTTDTVMYMYYGNGAASGVQNPTGVWDQYYKGVWHFPNGTILTANDSTSNGNNGSLVNTPTATTGEVDGGANFASASSQYISAGTGSSIANLANSNPFTISFWINPAATQSAMILARNDNNTVNGGWWVMLVGTLGSWSSTGLIFATEHATANLYAGVALPSNSTWTKVDIVYDGSSTSANQKFYYNGVLQTNNSDVFNASGAQGDDSSQTMYMGYPRPSTSGGVSLGYFNGGLDEIRLSSTTRSAAWIQTEYNDESSPGTYMTLAAEEQKPLPTTWYNTAWGYRKEIVIPHTQVSNTDQTNFPVLISTTDASLISVSNGGHVGLSNGGDILFTGPDQVTQYNDEIESYNATIGKLIAWVNVPTLSASVDTHLFMYYGNAGATNQQNSTGTWSNGYTGVWHFPNGTTLTANDSTSNDNNGSITAATATNGQIDGGMALSNPISGSYTSGNQYVTVSNAASLDPTSQISVEMWVYLSSSVIYSSPLTKSNSGSWVDGYGWYDYGANMYFWVDNYDDYYGGIALSTGVWTFIAGTYDGSTVRAYKNGALGTTTSTSGAITNYADDLFIGSGNSGPTTADFGWNGTVDEVKISNIARSANWIQTEYNNQVSTSSFFVEAPETSSSTATAAPVWYNSAWLYRMPLTIPHTQVSNTDQVNFPVLINTTVAGAQSTGYDILFTSGDAVTKLNHEIESYNSSTGQLVAWVKVPTLSHTVDTTLYMYYGNPSATNQQISTGTWDVNFVGVWHLPNGTTLTANDSTSNGNNGTLTSSPPAVTGQIDGAAGFTNGTGQLINLGTGSTINTLQVPMTISAWFKPTATESEAPIVAQYEATSGGELIKMIRLDSGVLYYYMSTSGGTFQYVTNSVTPSNNNWHHVAVSVSGSVASPSVTMTLDGSSTTLTPSSFDASPNGTVLTYIGADEESPTGEEFNGSIDEVHISSSARSYDWIKTEYNNQSSPSSFVIPGTPTTQSPTWYVVPSQYSYRQAITISHTMVSNVAQSNFTVLISTTEAVLANTANGGHVNSGSGYDIVFTSGDAVTKLNYEIESYNPATGNLIVWVKVSSLSATTDTTLYMYYGRSNATSQQNSTGTWDSSYVGVWHLPNGSTLTAKDSTSNGNNGTISGATATTGLIDGGASMSGTDVITMANSSSLNFTGPVTLSAWIYPTISNNYQTVIEKSASINVREYAFYLSYLGTGDIYLAFGDTNIGDTAVSPGWTVNAWNYVAVTANGTNVITYINGVQSSSISSALESNANAASTYIGNDTLNSNSIPVVGTEDEVRVCSVARSSNTIKTEYNNQSTTTYVTFGSETGLANSSYTTQSGNWLYRDKIVINHNQVSPINGTNLTDFPIVINSTNTAWMSMANGGHVGNSDGSDILFTSSDGMTKFNHEIETYTATTGNLVAWVQIPSLSASVDTVLYMYYGNPGVANQQNVNATWDSNYMGVWHLPNGATLTANDSTSHANNGTISGATATTGQIDGGASMSGTDVITMSNSSSLNFTGPITLSAWVYPTISNNYQAVIEKSASAAVREYAFYLSSSGTGDIYLAFGDDNIGNTAVSPGWTVNAWNYIVVTANGSNILTYINGVQSSSTSSSYESNTNTGSTYIGNDGTDSNGYPVVGAEDEVRVSNTVRSADWIATEYYNQSDPAGFYTFLPEQSHFNTGFFNIFD